MAFLEVLQNSKVELPVFNPSLLPNQMRRCFLKKSCICEGISEKQGIKEKTNDSLSTAGHRFFGVPDFARH